MMQVTLCLLILFTGGSFAETSSLARAKQNIAWVAQHLTWKEALGNWKKKVERTCNVSDADEYWRHAFSCPEISETTETTCLNEDARQTTLDSIDCPMTLCSDGFYSDQMTFFSMWRRSLEIYKAVISIYVNKLVICVCEETTCPHSDAVILEAWNSQSLKYSELSMDLMEVKAEMEQLQKKCQDWDSINEQYPAVLEASQLIEKLQNQSDAWDAQSETMSTLTNDLTAANGKIDQLQSQSAVWDSYGDSYATLSNEVMEANQQIKQLQNNSEVWNMQTQKHSDLSNEISKVSEKIQTLETKNQEHSTFGSVLNPASSCDEIKSSIQSAEDGFYYLKDLEGHVFQTFCSMNIAGGGWTLVASVHENNIAGKCTNGDRWSSEQGNNAGKPNGDGFWENRATHGKAASATSDDYKNSGYFAMQASDIMIWQVPNDTPPTSYGTSAFLKYHTTNGFLQSYGGNLASLYSVHYNMRTAQFTKNVDNGPSVPVVWDKGSNEEVLALYGLMVPNEAEAGYVQFRAINMERSAFALCPGVRINPATGSDDDKGNIEHICIGSTSGHVGHDGIEKYCGDYSAFDWDDVNWKAQPKFLESVVMIFYK